MDSGALGHTVNHTHDLALERRVDGLSPAVVVAGSSAEDQQPGRPRRMEMEPVTVVSPYEVEREPLTEQVGPVARDSVGRGVRSTVHSPPKGEIHHDGIELTHLPSASTWRAGVRPCVSGAFHRHPVPSDHLLIAITTRNQRWRRSRAGTGAPDPSLAGPAGRLPSLLGRERGDIVEGGAAARRLGLLVSVAASPSRHVTGRRCVDDRGVEVSHDGRSGAAHALLPADTLRLPSN